jgi:hypothetical protein
LKFNLFNFLGFSLYTEIDDGGILLVKVVVIKAILDGTTTS